jgi:parvulin-like peptidyl-prolyl isomerase
MIMRSICSIVLLAVIMTAVGCQSKEEPEYVTVQHILIAFEGSIPGKNVTRSKESARQLAQKVFEMAKSGKDFGELVKEFTDDAYPGVYEMANFGVAADMSQKIYPRDKMVAAFGDVGFPLGVGEIGLAEYDPQKSKYGWHVIKRVE